jgi:hypothetical protein
VTHPANDGPLPMDISLAGQSIAVAVAVAAPGRALSEEERRRCPRSAAGQSGRSMKRHTSSNCGGASEPG